MTATQEGDRMNDSETVDISVVTLETAGLVQLHIESGPIGLAVLLSKDEASSLSGELNSAGLRIDQAEGDDVRREIG